jgi:hypothetical protein
MFKHLFYFILIISHITFSFSSFPNIADSKVEVCSWGCKLVYYVCLENEFETFETDKINQLCKIKSLEFDDPRDCAINEYRNLSTKKHYEILKYPCRLHELDCIKNCMSGD